jgi:hypothetical protein
MIEVATRGRGLQPLSRRNLLKVSLGSIAGLKALNLVGTDRPALSAEAVPRRDTAVIQIWLGGGPSHLDMYDLKPAAPVEYRGSFRPIATNVPGIEISELLPLQARRMDRFSIIRSLHTTTSDHPAGTHWMQTGRYGAAGPDFRPTHPAAGAVAARVCGSRREGMVPYVHIAPDPMGFPTFIKCHESAYFGMRYNPLRVESARKAADINRLTIDNLIGRVQFGIPSFEPLPGVDSLRIGERVALNAQLDRLSRALDSGGTMDAFDHFQRQALEMLSTGAARNAFDLDRESPAIRDRYGRNAWGQGALLCRRLVEAGATFVTLNTDSFSGQWDNHGNLAVQYREMLPFYDQMLTALVDDLVARGMYERVLVLVWGEFGRTPKINAGAGRDHWGPAGFALVGGGGLRGGGVVGSTTAHGETPKDRPIWPSDILATVYRVLGIDPTLEFPDHAGRPIAVLPDGQPIQELVSFTAPTQNCS